MQEVFGSGLCLQETEGFNDKIDFLTINTKNGTWILFENNEIVLGLNNANFFLKRTCMYVVHRNSFYKVIIEV